MVCKITGWLKKKRTFYLGLGRYVITFCGTAAGSKYGVITNELRRTLTRKVSAPHILKLATIAKLIMSTVYSYMHRAIDAEAPSRRKFW